MVVDNSTQTEKQNQEKEISMKNDQIKKNKETDFRFELNTKTFSIKA